VGGLVDRLQAAAAKTVDRRAADAAGQAGEQRDNAADVKTLLALLLGIAKHDVFNDRGVDARALNHCTYHGGREIIRAHVTKDAALRVSATNGRATAINYDRNFHV
jgi:hypothetical protein